MAKITIGGAQYSGDILPGWSVTENATPVVPGDSTGSVGGGDAEVAYGIDTEFVWSKQFDFSADDLGNYYGFVEGVDTSGAYEVTSTSSSLNLTSPLQPLAANRYAEQVSPFADHLYAGNFIPAQAAPGLPSDVQFISRDANNWWFLSGTPSNARLNALGDDGEITTYGTLPSTAGASFAGLVVRRFSSAGPRAYTLSNTGVVTAFNISTSTVTVVNSYSAPSPASMAVNSSNKLFYHNSTNTLYVNLGANGMRRLSNTLSLMTNNTLDFTNNLDTLVDWQASDGIRTIRYEQWGFDEITQTPFSGYRLLYYTLGLTPQGIWPILGVTPDTVGVPIGATWRNTTGEGRITFLTNDGTTKRITSAALGRSVTNTPSTSSITTGDMVAFGQTEIGMIMTASRGTSTPNLQRWALNTTVLGAIAYYCALSGVTNLLFKVSDVTLRTEKFIADSWSDSVWTKIKEICTAYGFSVSVLDGGSKIIFSRLDDDAPEVFVDVQPVAGSVSMRVSPDRAAKKIKTLVTNRTYGERLISFDDFSDVSPREVPGSEIKYVQSPNFTTTVLQKSHGTNSYNVVDSEGNYLSNAQWNAIRGSVTMSLVDGVPTATLTYSPSESTIVPVLIPVTVRNLSTQVTGNFSAEETIDIYTGADPLFTPEEYGPDVTNPFIHNYDRLWDRAAWISAQAGSPYVEVSMDVPTSNIQTFGYMPNKRVRFKEANYRVYSVVIGAATSRLTLRSHTTAAEFDAAINAATVVNATNLFTNPDMVRDTGSVITLRSNQFATPIPDAGNTAAWVASGTTSGATIDYPAATGELLALGVPTMKRISAASFNAAYRQGILVGGLTVGQTYTFGMWGLPELGTANVDLGIYNGGDATPLALNPDLYPNGVLSYRSITWTATQTTIRLYMRTQNTVSTGSPAMSVSGGFVELAPNAMPPFYGSTPNTPEYTYEWVGTANSSVSRVRVQDVFGLNGASSQSVSWQGREGSDYVGRFRIITTGAASVGLVSSAAWNPVSYATYTILAEITPTWTGFVRARIRSATNEEVRIPVSAGVRQKINVTLVAGTGSSSGFVVRGGDGYTMGDVLTIHKFGAFEAASTPLISRTNWSLNPRLGADAANWEAASSASGTPTITGTRVATGGTPPEPGIGFAYRAQVTAGAPPWLRVRHSVIPVTPGEIITVSGYTRTNLTAGSGRMSGMYVQFRTPGNVGAGEVPSISPVSTTAWERYSVTTVVPSNATQMWVEFGVSSNTGAIVTGIFTDGTGVLIERSTELGTFFDGSTANVYPDYYRWTGTSNNSVSEYYTVSAEYSGPFFSGRTPRTDTEMYRWTGVADQSTSEAGIFAWSYSDFVSVWANRTYNDMSLKPFKKTPA